jgi:hypothetical protein
VWKGHEKLSGEVLERDKAHAGAHDASSLSGDDERATPTCPHVVNVF